MYYIAKDNRGNLIDHTMSDSRLTSGLAALSYQMQVAQTHLRTTNRQTLVAFDYPVVEIITVSESQYQRAMDKDIDHFKRLLVS